MFTVLLAVLGAFMIVIAIAGVLGFIINVVGRWKLFSKAGEEGWKAIIPFYGTYTMYKLTWINWLFVVTYIIPFVLGAFDSDQMGMAGMLVSIAIFAFNVASNYMVSISYGKGIGYTIGLTFLYPIFLLMLAFGKAQYIGPMGKPQQKLEDIVNK